VIQSKKFEKKFELEEDGIDVVYEIEYEINESNEIRRIKIQKTIYPLKNYGNNVKTIINISEGKAEPFRIEMYRVRNSWNGSGRDDIFAIEFNDYADESPGFLWIEKLEEIDSIEKLKEYVNYVVEWISDVMKESITLNQ